MRQRVAVRAIVEGEDHIAPAAQANVFGQFDALQPGGLAQQTNHREEQVFLRPAGDVVPLAMGDQRGRAVVKTRQHIGCGLHMFKPFRRQTFNQAGYPIARGRAQR